MARKAAFQIIFEDEHIFILNKATGIPVLPDRYDPKRLNLRDLLQLQFGRIFITHRLDTDTSGILLVAKTAESHKYFNQQFQDRKMHKTYLALLEGVPSSADFTIQKPIGHASQGLMKIHPRGKQAITHVRIIERFRHFALAEAGIATGRTHQIRVHLQSVRHPLVADPLYGIRKTLSIRDIKGNKTYISGKKEPRSLISRTALHAWRLAFVDLSGKTLEFKAPLPKDMRACIQQLRKWQS